MNMSVATECGTAALRSSAMDAPEQIDPAQDDSGASVALPAGQAVNREPIFGLPEAALMAGAGMAANSLNAAPTADGVAWLIADLTGAAGPASEIGTGSTVRHIREIGRPETRRTTGISTGDLSAADGPPPIAEVAGISDRAGYLSMSGAVGGMLLRSPLLQKKSEAVAPAKPSKRGAAYGDDHDAGDPSDALDYRRHGVDDQGDGGLL